MVLRLSAAVLSTSAWTQLTLAIPQLNDELLFHYQFLPVTLPCVFCLVDFHTLINGLSIALSSERMIHMSLPASSYISTHYLLTFTSLRKKLVVIFHTASNTRECRSYEMMGTFWRLMICIYNCICLSLTLAEKAMSCCSYVIVWWSRYSFFAVQMT